MKKPQKSSEIMDWGSIGVLHRTGNWLIGFAEALRAGKSVGEIEGLILYASDFDAIRVPIVPIVACLARGVDQNLMMVFWGGALQRIAYIDERGVTGHCYPGEPLPDGAVFDHAELNPDPKWLPFADIVSGMRYTARSVGLPVEKLLFQFRGTVIRDATTLFNMLWHRPAVARRARADLDLWRDSTFALVDGRMPRLAEDEGIPFPPELRGNILPRVRLAFILGRSSRTLIRWDRVGRTSGRLPWKPGIPISGNLVVYDLERSWTSITAFLGRTRDLKRDRLWLYELGRASLAANACKGSVLEDLVAEDARGDQQWAS